MQQEYIEVQCGLYYDRMKRRLGLKGDDRLMNKSNRQEWRLGCAYNPVVDMRPADSTAYKHFAADIRRTAGIRLIRWFEHRDMGRCTPFVDIEGVEDGSYVVDASTASKVQPEVGRVDLGVLKGDR